MDAALLAGAVEAAKGTPASTIPNIVNSYFQTNSGLNGAAKLDTQVDTTAGTVAGTAQYALDMAFMKMAGINSLNIGATSEASYSVGLSEVALALDTTGSMSGVKIEAAQKAANDLVDSLFSMPNASQNLRVSLVPFTYYVNVGLQYRDAAWISGAADTSTTTQQCWNEYPNAQYSDPYKVSATCYSDGTPYDCSYTAYKTVNYGDPVQQCGPVTSGHYWHGCVGSRNNPLDLADAVSKSQPVPALLDYWCSSPLMRLTNSRGTIKDQINSLSAGGETYVAPGLLWAWRTLSPSAPFSDGKPYSKTVAKTVVLMTDGANTHSPNYPDHEASDTVQADRLTATTCDNIKSAGVRVMTVAFEVTDSAIKKILLNCASSSADFYDATDINGMREAFKAIGAKLSAVRLVK